MRRPEKGVSCVCFSLACIGSCRMDALLLPHQTAEALLQTCYSSVCESFYHHRDRRLILREQPRQRMLLKYVMDRDPEKNSWAAIVPVVLRFHKWWLILDYHCLLAWGKNHLFYTECFTTCEHYCRRWFPRFLWSKNVHINMCPILDGYGVTGIFLIPVHTLVWTASYGTSWRVMYAAWWLIVCGSCNEQPRSSQQSGSLCCGRRWHFRKPALSTVQFKLKVISRS